MPHDVWIYKLATENVTCCGVLGSTSSSPFPHIHHHIMMGSIRNR